MSLQQLESNSFDEVIYDNAKESVVVFSRQSCAVCQELLPILEGLQSKYKGKYNFYYVDAEEQKNLLQRFSLKGVPQILFFNDGEYQGKLAGHVEDEDVEKKILEVF
jgi:thioredoxin 1